MQQIIYFLKQKEHNRVKVGLTTNFNLRHSQLSKVWGDFDSNSEIIFFDELELKECNLTLDNIEKTMQRLLKSKGLYIENKDDNRDGKTEFFKLDENILKEVVTIFSDNIVSQSSLKRALKNCSSITDEFYKENNIEYAENNTNNLIIQKKILTKEMKNHESNFTKNVKYKDKNDFCEHEDDVAPLSVLKEKNNIEALMNDNSAYLSETNIKFAYYRDYRKDTICFQIETNSDNHIDRIFSLNYHIINKLGKITGYAGLNSGYTRKKTKKGYILYISIRTKDILITTKEMFFRKYIINKIISLLCTNGEKTPYKFDVEAGRKNSSPKCLYEEKTKTKTLYCQEERVLKINYKKLNKNNFSDKIYNIDFKKVVRYEWSREGYSKDEYTTTIGFHCLKIYLTDGTVFMFINLNSYQDLSERETRGMLEYAKCKNIINNENVYLFKYFANINYIHNQDSLKMYEYWKDIEIE